MNWPVAPGQSTSSELPASSDASDPVASPQNPTVAEMEERLAAAQRDVESATADAARITSEAAEKLAAAERRETELQEQAMKAQAEVESLTQQLSMQQEKPDSAPVSPVALHIAISPSESPGSSMLQPESPSSSTTQQPESPAPDNNMEDTVRQLRVEQLRMQKEKEMMEAEIVRLRDARDYWAKLFIMQGMEQQHGDGSGDVSAIEDNLLRQASELTKPEGERIQEEERLNAEINKQKTLLGLLKDEESHMNALLQRQMTTFQLQAEATDMLGELTDLKR